MSHFETSFFACGFISTLAIALLATWFRYLPTLIAFYRFQIYQWDQPQPQCRSILADGAIRSEKLAPLDRTLMLPSN